MFQAIFQHPRYGKHFRQGSKFIVSGGLGATVDLVTLPLLVEYAHIPSSIAFYLSSLCAVIVVFLINKHVTFQSKDAYLPQMLKFGLVYGSTIILNGFVSNILYLYVLNPLMGLKGISMGELTISNYFLAKVLAIGLIIPVNYVLSHTFIFRSKSSPLVEQAPLSQ